MSIKDLIAKKDRYSPAESSRADVFREFHREMDRLFDEFFTDMRLTPVWNTPSAAAAFDVKVNVSETDETITVSAELPGMDKDDVSIELNDGALVISGEKKHEKEEKKKRWHRVERSYGSFQRVIPVPAAVQTDKVKATFKKGLLTVEMPKENKGDEGRKSIDISVD